MTDKTKVEAADPKAHTYPVLPRDFVQDKQFDIHKVVSRMHRVTNQWWDMVLNDVPHDPRVMSRTLRDAVRLLSGIADEVDAEIEAARDRQQSGSITAAGGGAAAGGDGAAPSPVGGGQPPPSNSGEAA